MERVRPQIDLELHGVGNGWTDVSRDVRATVPRTLMYGIQGTSPLDRVAGPGTFRFALDNSEANSVGLEGFYSPDNENARQGFDFGIRVRLTLFFYGEAPQRFLGELDDIVPTPGPDGERVTYCAAVDFMDACSRTRLRDIPLQVQKRSDEVFQTIVAAMVKQPETVTAGRGRDTFAYALDNGGSAAKSTALAEFGRIAASELALIYDKGGNLTHEGRHDRLASSVNDAVFSGNMFAMTTQRTRKDVLNRVRVTVHPRRSDTTFVTLFTLQAPIEVQVGQTIVFNAAYVDPEQKAVRVGGSKTLSGEPVGAGGNPSEEAPGHFWAAYTNPNGSGALLSYFANITVEFGATSAKVTIFNQGPLLTLYVTQLEIYGFGVYDFEPVEVEVEDTASQARFGVNELTLDMPYQGNPWVADGVARYLMAQFGQPRTNLRTITIECGEDEELIRQAVVRDISDRIGVSEAVTGISTAGNAGYFINAVALTIRDQDQLSVTWTLVPADPATYWILGVVGQSELGVNTIPAFV